MLPFYLERCGTDGRINRRTYLQLAGLSAFVGLTPARLASASDSEGAAAAGASRQVRRAKSVIVVLTSGGQSQLDTWDPKPEAPLEVRGEFRPIATAVPGTIICEHLPRLARLADKYTIIRTMSHADLDHGSAVYLSLTGRYHPRITSNPPPRPTDFPSLMSVYKRLRPEAGTIDPAIQINGPAIVAPQDIAPGQFGGLLGRDYDPLFIGDVNTDEEVMPGLAPLPDLSSVRIRQRESLLAAINRTYESLDAVSRVTDLQGQYRKAFELLQNPQTRRAFDVSSEPLPIRRRYGRNRAGQACLVARRLAEAGVPLITVVWNHHSRGQDREPGNGDAYGWDTHNDIFDALRNRLLPRFDQSFSALLEDLETREMLDETLVVCMGEFGRAPVVALEPNFAGASPGRKHWSAAYSVLLAGAGIARGKIVGKTDRHGAYPVSDRFGPWDLAATIFSALGIDPAGHFFDRLERPFPISVGSPIHAAYANHA